MIAILKRSTNGYLCSKCKMRQPIIVPYCDFCGAEFSNYEETLLENLKDIEDPRDHLDKNIMENFYE